LYRYILEHKHDEPDFEKWEQWGNEILTTAVFSIILTVGLVQVESSWLETAWSKLETAWFHQPSSL
jgi:hypothetical protein